MEFRILGPLEVIDGGETLPLGGPRQRLVLAYLLLEANRVIPTDRLIGRIWGDEPPDAARSALFAYISRLKKLLGPSRIQARPPGYVLVATANEVDALRFAGLVAGARSQPAPATRLALLSAALGLWRGEPLSDLADHDALAPAIAGLEEQRLTALEEQATAQLDAGAHAQAVPALQSLVREHPLRERLWSLLMLALYRSGRQAEALAAFHRARRVLDEELGIDPSPELRELHERILRQEPELSPPAASAAMPAAEIADVLSLPASQVRARRMGRAGAIALASLVGVGVIAAAWWTWRPAGHLPPGRWTIAVDMPLSANDDDFLGQLVSNAVAMAVDDANASGRLGGTVLGTAVFDDHGDPDVAAANAQTIVDDPTVIAMIGPWDSPATFGVISITNAAGLLECGPSATHPGLTKPRYGALDLRPERPDQLNFIRLAPSDDIQSLALAALAYRDLGARSVLVIDVAGQGGRPIADAFETEYRELGGTPVRQTLNEGARPESVLGPLSEPTPPGIVFLAAQPETAAALRRAMADGGWLSTPLLSWDALLYYSSVYWPPAGSGRYVELAGADAAVGTYAAHASVPDHKFTFADAYCTRFGTEPDEYAAAGYACVEIIAEALVAIAQSGPSAEDLREMVRAYAVDPAHRYETVVGNVGFDANGDALQQFVTFYRFDPSAASGAGAWVVFKKQDFGPAR